MESSDLVIWLMILMVGGCVALTTYAVGAGLEYKARMLRAERSNRRLRRTVTSLRDEVSGIAQLDTIARELRRPS